jgi:hypothetical protein
MSAGIHALSASDVSDDLSDYVCCGLSKTETQLVNWKFLMAAVGFPFLLV